MRKLLLALPLAALFATLLGLAVPGRWPSPAYACSIQYPPIDYEVFNADAVALVKAVEAGGPDNPAPTQTPDPKILHRPGFGGTPIISLEGIGATLQVEQVLAGSVPSQVKVDEQRRESTEDAIRYLEANPGWTFPCALDFSLQRWTAGARYVVFLHKDDSGRWNAELRYQIAGSDVIVGFGGDGHPPLIVSNGVYLAHFAGLAANPLGRWFGTESAWYIQADTAPLTTMLAAVRDIDSGLFPLPTATPEHEGTVPTLTPAPSGRIIPPDTGDAGLR
jgi:hypothetical protein